MQIYTYIQGVQHNLIGDISDNGTPLFSGGEDAELPIADSSYRFSEIMGDDNCIINFSLPVFYEFPIGCFIIVDYTAYTLLELGQVTKQNERWYDYTLTFESPAKQLSRYKFRNYVDGRLNFTITAQPQEFLDHICRNMNMDGRDSGWTVGDCIVSSEKTQSFSHNTVADALNSVAQLFETEWEIVGKVISLKKIEYYKSEPLPLSYGKGNGFKSGITRQLSDEKAVDVLWVEGGDRNIDGRKYTYHKDGEVYHANKLRLPRDSRFIYIPSNGIADASGKIDRGLLFTRAEWDAKSAAERGAYAEFMAVKTDKDGFGVERETRINNGYEESLEATDIYPHKVLQVASAVCVDAENRFWDITAKTTDGSPVPDYNECLIGGVTVTTVFNSGMLSGKEFNIANQGTDENPIVVKNNVFKIQPADIDGITMPDLPTENDPEYSQSGLPSGTGYVPHINDEFGIFHVFLPNQYVEEAELELLLTACEYLWKHGEVEVEFNGTVDGIWAKKQWGAISKYIKLGSYVAFTDHHIIGEEIVTENGETFSKPIQKLMRVLSVKQYINNPHSPELTLSNSSVSQGVATEIKKIPQNQVSTRTELTDVLRLTQRGFKDAEETSNAVKALLDKYKDYFTEAITPIAVNTMHALIGNKDLQLEFGSINWVGDSSDPYYYRVTDFRTIQWAPVWNATTRTLVCSRVQMRHLYYPASNGDTIQPTRNVSSYPYWDCYDASFSLSNDNSTYYLYLQATKAAVSHLGFLTGANFRVFSKAEIEANPTIVNHTSSDYFFEVGIINNNIDGNRSFSPLYGYTEISGGRIGTDMIRSKDGSMYIDLQTGIIVGRFNFKNGLISQTVYVGETEESAIAGIGGDYAYWAGKNTYRDPITEGHPYLPIFSVKHDGTLRIADSQGILFEVGGQHGNETWAKKLSIEEYSILKGGFSANNDCEIYNGSLFVGKNIEIGNNGGHLKQYYRIGGAYNNGVEAKTVCVLGIFTISYTNNAYTYSTKYRAQTDKGRYFSVQSISRLGKGDVSITFSQCFSSGNDYIVVANGMYCENVYDTPLYVTVREQKEQSIRIYLSDDSSKNDGSARITILAYQ